MIWHSVSVMDQAAQQLFSMAEERAGATELFQSGGSLDLLQRLSRYSFSSQSSFFGHLWGIGVVQKLLTILPNLHGRYENQSRRRGMWRLHHHVITRALTLTRNLVFRWKDLPEEDKKKEFVAHMINIFLHTIGRLAKSSPQRVRRRNLRLLSSLARDCSLGQPIQPSSFLFVVLVYRP